MRELADKFEALPEFTVEATEKLVKDKGEKLGGMGAVVHPIRVAVSGVGEGPGLFELLALIGRDRVCARCRKAAEMAG